MLRYQRTLKTEISCEGIGLHSGTAVTMKIKPAPENTGIVFVRTDLNNAKVKAIASNTAITNHATTLGKGGVFVKTIEHLLAALGGLHIDNVYVELDAEEVPIMDGSARPFVRMIAEAGIAIQDAVQPALKIIRPIFVREADKQIAIWPAEATSISCFIDFDHPLLKEQSVQYVPSEHAFLRDVSDARTFGFLKDLKKLSANGLAMGASLENTIALDDSSVLNKEGLRYRDEFARHKLLDLIGDLTLMGMPIIGHIVAHKSGHSLNAQMVAKLLNSPEHWMVLRPTPAEERKIVAQPLSLLHATVPV